jgi:hypothetical protein
MKQHTNQILFVVLLLLLSAFVLTKVFRTPALESNLDTDLFRVDTGKVAAIKLQPPGDEKELTLERKDSGWILQQHEKTATAERYAVKNLLLALNTLMPERIISRKQEKWDDYNVGDSTALHVITYDEKADELSHLLIGKESGGSSYVRAADQDEVYAVEGGLQSRFSKGFNEWRDKTFLRTEKARLSKITFRYPADTGFVLLKNGRNWMINEEKADSIKVQNLLDKIQFKELSNFADSFAPAGEADVTMIMEGSSGPRTVVRGWKAPGRQWILNSSLQETAYFSDSTFAQRLFVGKKGLLSQ